MSGILDDLGYWANDLLNVSFVFIVEGKQDKSRLPLLLIILGGAFNAYINLFYYSLIIMQKRRHIFVIYALVAGAAFLISSPFVRWMGILGGALSYLMLMFALTVCFGLTALYFYRKENRNGRKMAK